VQNLRSETEVLLYAEKQVELAETALSLATFPYRGQQMKSRPKARRAAIVKNRRRKSQKSLSALDELVIVLLSP
jgi:hypothetical protein